MICGFFERKFMVNAVISQSFSFDLKGQYLNTKFSDGSVQSERITAEEAAQWTAENKF